MKIYTTIEASDLKMGDVFLYEICPGEYGYYMYFPWYNSSFKVAVRCDGKSGWLDCNENLKDVKVVYRPKKNTAFPIINPTGEKLESIFNSAEWLDNYAKIFDVHFDADVMSSRGVLLINNLLNKIDDMFDTDEDRQKFLYECGFKLSEMETYFKREEKEDVDG